MAANDPVSNAESSDRSLIHTQLWVGAGLVVFGALLLVIFSVTGVTTSDPGTMNLLGSISTGVLATGAALLPSTAAGAASARILSRESRSQDPPTVGATTVEAGGDGVTAEITSPAQAVGLYVQTALAGAGFADPPEPFGLVFVAPSATPQQVRVPFVTGRPTLGARVRVVARYGADGHVEGPSVST